MTAHDHDAAWPVQPELHVSDPAAVDVLWHPAKRVHLRPFLGRSCGLAEAAEMLGVKKTAMSYWLKRLLALQLIRPRGSARRGSRNVTLYRCVADRLRVHLRDAPHDCYEAVFEDSSSRWRALTLKALARSMARQAPWLELSIEAGPASGLGTMLSPCGTGAPPDDYLHYWGRLWLAPGEAAALRQELDALWERYAALSDQAGKTQRMLLHMVAVPEAAP